MPKIFIILSIFVTSQQTEATRLALEKLTNEKISAAMPVKRAEQRAPAQYIRYSRFVANLQNCRNSKIVFLRKLHF